MRVKCTHCRRITKKLKRPNPVLKGMHITHHYCPECKIVYTVMNSRKDPIVLSRPIREGDRVEGETFRPWYCR